MVVHFTPGRGSVNKNRVQCHERTARKDRSLYGEQDVAVSDDRNDSNMFGFFMRFVVNVLLFSFCVRDPYAAAPTLSPKKPLTCGHELLL